MSAMYEARCIVGGCCIFFIVLIERLLKIYEIHEELARTLVVHASRDAELFLHFFAMCVVILHMLWRAINNLHASNTYDHCSVLA